MQIQENTNKAIAQNTMVLYLKLVVMAICGFLTTRFALQALGIVDYGLFSVLGSIISFMAILNTIMVSTTNRFIAVSLGNKDEKLANVQFNVCVVFHLIIALLTAIIAYPIGSWYIHTTLHYEGDLFNALFVYYVSVTASIISFISVPFAGLLNAKENFWEFCIPPMIGALIRLGVAILITYYFTHKLLIFSFVTALYSIYPPIHYIRYCQKRYKPIVRFVIVRDWKLYKEISLFSGWVAYGAVAYVGKAQGAAVLINLFFNTVMNTALGIANTINGILGQISRSASQSIDPQITKNFASGNRLRCDSLLVFSTKISFLVMFIISTPFLVDCKWVLSLWLGKVPDFAVIFTVLMIIDNLVDSMNSGVKSIIFASGKIKLFQIIPSTLKLLSIIVAYIVLNYGFPAYYLIIVYILFSLIVVISNQIILKMTVQFDNLSLIMGSYLPSLYIVILSLPVILYAPLNIPVLRILFALAYVVFLTLLIGLKNKERKALLNFVKKKSLYFKK